MKKTVVLALLALLALLAILVWNNVVWDNAISRKKEVPADGHNHELCLSMENDWYEMIQPTPTPTNEEEMIPKENPVPTPTKDPTPPPTPTNEEEMIPKENPVPTPASAPTPTNDPTLVPTNEKESNQPTPSNTPTLTKDPTPPDEKVMTPKESNQPN